MQIDFSFDYQLQNNRVLLRPLTIDDVPNLLPFAITEPELWRFSLTSGAGEQGIRDYINQAVKERQEQNEYPFIVWDKQAEVYAGSTRFYDIQPANKTLQLGFTWYGKAFHAKGLNKNCKLLLLELAFDQWGFERVEFRADNENKRSIAAMQSIGCTVEGVLRSHMPKPAGGRRDSIILSILKTEWEGHVRRNLQEQVKKISQDG